MMNVNSDTDVNSDHSDPAQARGTSQRSRPKEIWIICHRWIGIILGLPIALIGLSGSLIYLTPLLLTLQHGDILSQSGTGASGYQQPAAWVDSVRKANGDGLEIVVVAAPEKSPLASETALVVGHTHKGAEGEYHRVFSVDPYTSKLKGHYDFETSYAYIPVGIHTSLMIPVIGLDFVAILGIILLFSSISGIYLWWPRQKSWKSSFRFDRNSRGVTWWFSLHNFIGLYSAIALLILSATGVWLLKPDWIEPAIKPVSGIRGAPSATLISKASGCEVRTTAEQALDLAFNRFPDRQLVYLINPDTDEDRDYFEINMGRTGDWNARDGDTTVYVDPVCARITSVTDAATLSTAEAAQRATVPIHNGLAFGPLGQVLVFLAGLSLPVLYVTGLVVWWRRRKVRRAR